MNSRQEDSALSEEIRESARLLLEDGSWDPLNDENRSLGYTMRKKSERTYAKNAAIDTTYQVQIDDRYQGQRLRDIRRGLHRMFEDILDEARGDLAGNDLGRVVVHHDGLQDPIVVPLQPWDRLNVDVVMGQIEKVLNSHQELAMNESFEITIGSINLPKGSGRRPITSLEGDKNSIQIKKSIVTIDNDDQLCMARAIGVGWAKLNQCTKEEWEDLTRSQKFKTNLELILEHRKVPESYYKNLRHKARKEQKNLAVALSRLAGVPLDRPASLNDVEAFEKALDIRVMVVSARLGNKFITSPSTDQRPCVYLYLVDDCHYHTISSVTGFFSARYFCSSCLKHYNNRNEHECEVTCIVCKTTDCLKTEETVTCQICHMTCRSQKCYQRHSTKQKGRSECETWWKCTTCYKVINTTKREKEDHRCGEYHCTSCDKYVMRDHLCYLRSIPAKEEFIPKFIFADFECSQDERAECTEGYVPLRNPDCMECQPGRTCTPCSKCQRCKTSWCGKPTHKPNFVVAHTVCPSCIERPMTSKSTCQDCGTRCMKCEDRDAPCQGCGLREVIFQGQDTSRTFGKWLFSSQHKYFKTVCHNMKGYDGYFLLEYLIDQSMRPDKIIYNGSKIMYMTVEKDLHIKVIDSLNFLPMKLSKLPEVFGLKELKKGWFPHFFNTRENQRYVGPYPNPKYYGCDVMGNEEREKCLAWLESKENCVFDFKKEMLNYCRSDVDILRQACLKFRDLLMSATGDCIRDERGKPQWTGAVDPFDSVTIASVCMNVYRTKFLEEEWRVKLVGDSDWVPAKYMDGRMKVLRGDQWVSEAEVVIGEKEFVCSPIAKIPPGGYKIDQYSKSSIQYLEWVSRREGVKIQHALNGGEVGLPGTRYKVDGYCHETNTSYEFHGCVFHGCPRCFPEDREETKHPLTRQSMSELYALTMKKKSYIEEKGMKYVCMWEHEFREIYQNDPELRHYLQNLDITDRLDPRESFFGGRTNASQLYYRVKETEQIKYVDFTSLYPWVNKTCQYPVGHPEVITSNFRGLDQYFGIAKVRILPPRGLYHPVLPYRSNGKLKFPLCQTCAENENPSPCACSDEDRTMTGTWCTPELQTAVRLGYQVLKIYEVYHWKETTQYDPETKEGGLFASYINTFLKFKQEASGPPDWVKTPDDAQEYIDRYFEKEGVSLDGEKIEKNPGLRALAKLCLNSFWGKFGQRLNLKQSQFYHETEADAFFRVLSDPTKEVQNFHIVANDTIQVEWIYKKDCQPEDNKTNIYLATFTTCWARLKLYSVLEKLNRNVLYYDTDSVIYVSSPGKYDPPIGDYLGELTNELKKGEHIVEFVSGGPKNYAYKTNRGNEMCKVRGFTLHVTNSQLINFESVKRMVLDPSETTITVTNPQKICRDKGKRKLYNREEQKHYQMVYTKRRRLDNYDTEPFGY